MSNVFGKKISLVYSASLNIHNTDADAAKSKIRVTKLPKYTNFETKILLTHYRL